MIRAVVALALALCVVGHAAPAAGDASVGLPDAPPPPGDALSAGNGLVVDPSFIDFGTASPSGADVIRTFDLRNENFTAISVTGYIKPLTPGCAPFSIQAVPPSGSIPPGQAWTWSATFEPTSAGSFFCTVTISDNDGNADTVTLTGVAGTPTMVTSPTSIPFGNVLVGDSVSQFITVRNEGTADLLITSVSSTGAAFSLPGDSPAVLGPGDAATIEVVFTPPAAAVYSGSVTIMGSDPANVSDTVSLSGTGVAGGGGAQIVVMPDPVAFNSVAVGGQLDVSTGLRNQGNQTASVTQVMIIGPDAGHFSIEDTMFGCSGTQTCPIVRSITQNSTYTFNTRCKPTSHGSKTATLVVIDNSVVEPTATLTCTGTAPDIVASPPMLGFGTVRVNTTSSSMPLSITNDGNANLTYTISFTGANPGDFAATPACMTTCTLAPDVAGLHQVTFHPTAYGTRTATLVITSNDPDLPMRMISLSGTGGGGILAVAQPSTRTLNFGDIPVAIQSAPATVRLRNDGNLALRLVGTAMTDPGAMTYTVFGSPLPPPDVLVDPGDTVDVTVYCTPELGANPGTFTMQSDAVVAPANADITLACNGVNGSILADPSPVVFPETLVGDEEMMSLQLRNVGGAAVTVDSITTAAPFELIDPPGSTVLAPNDELELMVRFAPTADGDINGTLVVTPTTGDPLMVALFGPGRVAAYELTPDGTSYDFGTVCVGDGVLARFSVMSSGSADITVDEPTLTGSTGPAAGFSLSMVEPPLGGYPVTLGTGELAELDVVVVPPGAGDGSAALNFTTDVGAPVAIALSVAAITEGVATSPGELDLGEVEIDATSEPGTVTVSNCDAASLVITEVTIEGDDADAFRVGGTLPPPDITLLSTERATWSVVFEPERVGAHAAALVVRYEGGEITVPLAGVAPDPAIGPDGGLGLDTTSFYACTCQGGAGGPGGALPIAGVFAWLLLGARRRRRA